MTRAGHAWCPGEDDDPIEAGTLTVLLRRSTASNRSLPPTPPGRRGGRDASRTRSGALKAAPAEGPSTLMDAASRRGLVGPGELDRPLSRSRSLRIATRPASGWPMPASLDGPLGAL